MPKVFATSDKCLLLRCVCDILNAVLHFARNMRHFVFCVQFLNLCVKRGNVLKMFASSYTSSNSTITVFLRLWFKHRMRLWDEFDLGNGWYLIWCSLSFVLGLYGGRFERITLLMHVSRCVQRSVISDSLSSRPRRTTLPRSALTRPASSASPSTALLNLSWQSIWLKTVSRLFGS